jgi:hypothetical protein
VVGGFLLMNLALAVVYDSYMENKEEGVETAKREKQAEQEAEEEARARRKSLGLVRSPAVSASRSEEQREASVPTRILGSVYRSTGS